MLRIVCYLSILLIDLAAISAAFTTTGYLRGEFQLKASDIDIKWLLAAVYVLIASNTETINRSAFGSRLVSIMKALQALLMASAVTVMILFFTRMDQTVSRMALAAAFTGSALLMTIGRAVFLTLFLKRRDLLWESHLLICDGTQPPAEFNGGVIEARPDAFDLDTGSPESVAKLGELASRYDRIVIDCIDERRRADWARMLKNFDTHGELLLDKAAAVSAIGIGRIGSYETLIITRGTLSLNNRVKKRCFDILAAGLCLALISPLLVAVAISIKFDSPGPVLFRQPRVGFHNRSFRIFKFRSMRHEPSGQAGALSTQKGDQRITRFGRFIRRTSIDELPQLFNVLLGDMSIVGPRPHALGSLAGEELFWEVDGAYWKRHSLKPGITGLAQVRGFRGATHTREDLINRLGADMEYVDGWSLWRDLRIILATARVMMHTNAY